MAADPWAWGWEAVAAVGTVAAIIVALGIALKDTVSRWLANRAQRKVWSTAFLVPLLSVKAAVARAMPLADTGVEMDTGAEHAQKLVDTLNMATIHQIQRDDTARLTDCYPDAAARVVAGLGALDMVQQLAGTIGALTGDNRRAERREAYRRAGLLLEVALGHVDAAVALCTRHIVKADEK